MVKKRKTIALDEEIVEQVANIARSKGMSLSNYLRRLLSVVMKAEEHGVNPEQALIDQIILKYAKHAGLAFTPIQLVQPSENDWKNLGYRLGIMLKIKGLEKEVALKNTILMILSGIGEVTIEKTKKTYRVTCVTNKVDKKILQSIILMIEELARQYNTRINKLIEEGIIVIETPLEE